MSERKRFKCKSEAQKQAIRRNYAIKNNKLKSVENEPKNDFDMYLARIPNKYMFKNSDSGGSHLYVVYQDDKTKEMRAIETTHLYIPDNQNMDKVRKGLLYKTTFAGYETPSGVHNTYYNTDINNKPIVLNKTGIEINKNPLPYKQAKAIKEFAKMPRDRNK